MHSRERYKHKDTIKQTQTHKDTDTECITIVHSRQVAEVELYSDGQYVKSDQEKHTVAALFKWKPGIF